MLTFCLVLIYILTLLIMNLNRKSNFCSEESLMQKEFYRRSKIIPKCRSPPENRGSKASSLKNQE